MAYYTQLLDNLCLYDIPVIEIDGWRTRGNPTFNPDGGVNHHTAGPVRGIAPSLNVCINGRPDVPGPLCHVLGGRDHVARLIACGRANHAGLGGAFGLSGNSSVFGLEMEHTGVAATEAVKPETVDFMARIQAAFARTGGYTESTVMQHYEWAPRRKIDFVKGSFHPDDFRKLVGQYIRWGGPKPPGPSKPTEEQEIMTAKDDIIKATQAEVDKIKPVAVRVSKDGFGMKQGQVWIVGPYGRYHVNRDTLNTLYFIGQIRRDPNGQPNPVDPKQIADIPVLSSHV